MISLLHESSVILLKIFPHSQLIKLDGYYANKVFTQARVNLIDANKSPFFFTTGLQTITKKGDKVIHYQKEIY